MSNEIVWDTVPGWILKAYRFMLNGNVILSNGVSNEVWGTGGRGADDYDIPVPEIGVGISGHYVGDFDPDDILATAKYRVVVARMRGANPADSDLPGMAKGMINWDGVNYKEIYPADESDINGLNNFDPVNDDVAHVTLVDTTTTNTDMVGTNGANTVVPDVAGIAATLHGATDALLAAIKVVTDNLAASATTLITGTVSWNNTEATTSIFYSDDITEATKNHYKGRIVIFTSGTLFGQATDITDYTLVSGEGKFTVTALTEAPENNATFVIV